MGAFLSRIPSLVSRRPGRVLAVFGLLLLAAVLTTGSVRFERDVFEALPSSDPAFRVLVHAMKNSAADDKLYFLVREREDRGADSLVDACRALAGRLEGITLDGRPAFSRVTLLKRESVTRERFEALMKTFASRPGIFIAEHDLPRLERFLASPPAMERELKRSLALLAAPGSSPMSGIVAGDPLNLRRFMLEKLRSMHHGLEFAPGPHLLSPDRRSALLIATPAEWVLHEKGDRLLEAVEAVRSDHPGLRIGMTGGYAVVLQEEALVRGDILGCLLGSVLGVGLLFLLIYRSAAALSFVLVPLGVGLQLAVGVLALGAERLHMLAMAFSAVVLGLGIDFAVHVYDRYLYERKQGGSVETAVRGSVLGTGKAVVAGGLTTLSAFLVLSMADNPLLEQTAWLVALGLLFCMVTILLALPAGLVLLERIGRRGPSRPPRTLGMERLGRWVGERPRAALVLSLLLAAAALPGLFRIEFETDLSALRPRGLEALEVQEELLEAFGSGSDYVLAAWGAGDREALRREGLALDRLLEEMVREGRAASWTSLTRTASLTPVHVEGLEMDLVREAFERLGLSLEHAAYDRAFLEAVRERRTVHLMDWAAEGEGFPDLLRRFVLREDGRLSGLAWVLAPEGVPGSALAEALEEARPDLLVVSPELAVRGLVREVRSELWTTLGAAAGLVLLILFAFFRDGRSVLRILVPVSLGVPVTAGVMGLAGVTLNPFNFVVLPILVGIGLDDGIHIVRRYRELGDVALTLATTGRSVLVTTLTTICGFGSLALADYHVLVGMGLIAVTGVAACFLFSVLTLPALLRLREPPARGVTTHPGPGPG